MIKTKKHQTEKGILVHTVPQPKSRSFKSLIVVFDLGGILEGESGGDSGSDSGGDSPERRRGLQVLLYDLRGSRHYTQITELTHRLRTHSRRLIHESSLATATGICNRELPWTSMVFQALMYIKTELLLR